MTRAKAPPARRSSIIRINRRYRSYGIVPDDLLRDRSVSSTARLVLAYLVGRPEGWEPAVGHVCAELGITDFGWRSLRRELEAAGILTQHRYTGTDGRMAWSLRVDLTRYD